MNSILGWLSRLVTARPFITLLVLLLITVLLGAGVTRRAATAGDRRHATPGKRRRQGLA